MPCISVIVPVYNAEKFLPCCLESLRRQTLKDIEIIAVNDGSTDCSAEILKQTAAVDKRLKIISQKNSGVSAARNKGLREAVGDFVCFVDADDYVCDSFLEKLYQAAVAARADIAAGEIIYIKHNKNKQLLKLKKSAIYKTTLEKYLACGMPRQNFVWNKIYRRTVLTESGVLFTEGMCFEDVEWSHKALHFCGDLVTVPGAIYYYRQNSASLANRLTEKTLQDYKQAFVLTKKFLRLNHIDVREDKFPVTSLIRITFCGLPLLKIKIWDNLKIYYLLGLKWLKIRRQNNFEL